MAKSFKNGGFAVFVDSLFIVALTVCRNFVLGLLCKNFVLGLCFEIQYLVSFLVLQSSRLERKSWLLYFNWLYVVMWLFSVSSSW